MFKIKRKRIISTLAVLAVAATATLSGLSFVSGSTVPSYIANADTTVNNTLTEDEVNVYYVGTPEEGAEGSGTSPEDPMSTTNFVSQLVNLQPGDIVYIMPGVHECTTTWSVGRTTTSESTGVYISGTYDNYIIFKAYDETRETALSFYGQSFSSSNRGVHIYGNYYYWYGIDICGAGDNGMYIGGSYNIIENCEFYDNRDTGLQLGRNYSSNATIDTWPSYNLIKNCTSHNNYDNETKGENADGFAAKLTVGYYNVFDGCIAYRNSDDGWDLYGKDDTGIIGTVYMYNCVAFENGFLEYTQAENNARYASVTESTLESNQESYTTANGDGNGFKLGGSTLEGDVFMYNCLSFNNRMHGVTDNSNPGVISLNNVTSYNNSATIDNDPTSDTFGQVTGYSTDHNNIDIRRADSSYNNMTGILSVYNGRTGTDAYQASASNSLLAGGSSAWYKITDAIDADSTDSSKRGETVTALSAEDIFEALPANNLGVDRTLDIHSYLRNSDGSVNMQGILEIKDSAYASLGFEEGEIGSALSDENGDYIQPAYSAMTAYESEAEGLAAAIYDMIYVPVNQDAVYQDFDLSTAMPGAVNVTWTSSNPDVIEITDDISTSISGVTHQRAVVWRDADKDVEVKLTATATVSGIPVTKTFTLTVKQNEYIVGDIEVEGVDITNDSYITSQYSLEEEPEITVYNAADYNGKSLPEGSYTLETTYMYATEKGGTMVQVAGFSTSNAGIYQITHKVTCGNTSNEYTYTLYVVDDTATVDFMEEPEVNVTYGGFTISGELNSVSGTLYAMVSDTEPTMEEFRISGQSYTITTDEITAQFTADNDGAYTIYYVVCNPNGDQTSKIYSSQITIQEISTTAEFQALISGGSQSNVIYKLTADLDFTDFGTWNPGSSGFSGYIDGDGHTISNLTVSASSNGKASIIYRLSGGTIINLNFDEITLTSTANQVGIIGQAYSGNLVNIKITNIDVHSSGQRVAALIGHVFEANGTLPLVIDRISIINDEFHGITSEDRRAGGIIGFIQVNSSPTSATVDIRISNCYVDSIIGDRNAVSVLNDDGTVSTPDSSLTYSGQQFGGIVGTYDASSTGAAYITTFTMTIEKCYFVGTVAGSDRVAGIIGYQQGLGTLTISNCVSAGDIYYQEAAAPISSAEKNASGIFGGYSSSAPTTVAACYAKFEEHNSNYFVNVYVASDLESETFWSITLGFDLDSIWVFDSDSEHYVSLR